MEPAKLFRQMYVRPEYLLSTIELAPSSWVMVSQNSLEELIEVSCTTHLFF